MPLGNRLKLVAVIAAAATALALSGCAAESGSAESTSSTSADSAYPVTMKSTYGSTTIKSEPKRVVTWGWGSTEAALALGVVPVAIGKQSYGANADGVMPWVADKLKDMGAKTPTLLTDDGETVPYEEIIAAQPDVILAPYSGLTQEQFDKLSDIAPVVAFTGEPWTMPWRDVITTVGTALGQVEQSKAVVADLDKTVADEEAAHPELEGKTVASVVDSAGTFYVYRSADPRVDFLTSLGLTVAPSVDELANGDSSFFYTLSYEQLDKLSSDIVVDYAETQDVADAFLASKPIQAMPGVKSGAVAQVIGAEYVAAVSPPTALSLTYGLDDFMKSLSEAAAKAK